MTQPAQPQPDQVIDHPEPEVHQSAALARRSTEELAEAMYRHYRRKRDEFKTHCAVNPDDETANGALTILEVVIRDLQQLRPLAPSISRI